MRTSLRSIVLLPITLGIRTRGNLRASSKPASKRNSRLASRFVRHSPTGSLVVGGQYVERARVRLGTHRHGSRKVPEISRFLGIVIYMYYNDHDPPHVHAKYHSHEMRVDVELLRVLSGGLPPRSRQHVMDWVKLRRSELLTAWTLARQRKPLPRIEPLE